MNQRDLERRFENIENKYEVLNQLESQTAHKATVAWGLALGLEADIRQIKVDVSQVKIELNRMREDHGAKLEQILQFLQPKQPE